MADAVEESARKGDERRVVALISAAHFVSHFYMLLLPPLFSPLQAAFGVSFTALSLAMVAFNLATAAFQMPAGFLSDAWGARGTLALGLIVGALAVAGAAAAPVFSALVACFAVAGLANTAYHPAAYAILAHRVAPERLGAAFSIHTFAGFLGAAAAPGSLIALETHLGWRGALVCAAILGAVVGLVILAAGARLTDRDGPRPAQTDQDRAGTLWTPDVLRNFAVFACLAAANSGIQGYTVVALDAAWGMPLATGASALSAFLVSVSLGVLAGGWVAQRSTRHARVMALGLGVAALVVCGIALVRLAPVALVAAFALGGFANGLVLPSRDLIVRAITPPGAFGRVFAAVSLGFSLGAIAGPPAFGLLMDHGLPRAVFALTAAFTLAALLLSRPWRRPPPPQTQ